MLEETHLDYALVTVFVEAWIYIGSCRRLLLDDGETGSYSGPEVGFEDIATDLREPRLWITSCLPIIRGLSHGGPNRNI
jgi:hypothetical protein